MRPKLISLVLLVFEMVRGEVLYELGHFNLTIVKWSVDIFSLTPCSLTCTLTENCQFFAWDDTPSGGPRCHVVQSATPSTTPVWLYRVVYTLKAPLNLGLRYGWRTCHNDCKDHFRTMYPVPQQRSGLTDLFNQFGTPFVFLDGFRRANTHDFYDSNGQLVAVNGSELFAPNEPNEQFGKDGGLWETWERLGDVMSEPDYQNNPGRICVCV